ncbi:anti-sigma factor [Candidatus Uhrbacteria bacterium]|nr:anti-sigma factor [Candidatus Uhrbacteria bacterium]
MKRIVIFPLITLLLVGGGCLKGKETLSTETVSDTIDRGSILIEAKENGLIMKDEEIAKMKAQPLESDAGTIFTDVSSYEDVAVKGWISAALADVTGGDSFGLAYAHFEDGTYTIISKMGNLPEPAQGYFYEGWLVRRGDDFSVLSIGHAVKTEKGYMNVYQSPTDLSDHAFYVLTLEPEDGNTAPEEHILEGSFR